MNSSNQLISCRLLINWKEKSGYNSKRYSQANDVFLVHRIFTCRILNEADATELVFYVVHHLMKSFPSIKFHNICIHATSSEKLRGVIIVNTLSCDNQVDFVIRKYNVSSFYYHV